MNGIRKLGGQKRNNGKKPCHLYIVKGVGRFRISGGRAYLLRHQDGKSQAQIIQVIFAAFGIQGEKRTR